MIRLPEHALNAEVHTTYHRGPVPLRFCQLCPENPPEVALIEVSSTDFPSLPVGENHLDAAVQLAIQVAVDAGDSNPRINVEVSIPVVPGVEVGETDERAAA